jgi:hypothetical protein
LAIGDIGTTPLDTLSPGGDGQQRIGAALRSRSYVSVQYPSKPALDLCVDERRTDRIRAEVSIIGPNRIRFFEDSLPRRLHFVNGPSLRSDGPASGGVPSPRSCLSQRLHGEKSAIGASGRFDCRGSIVRCVDEFLPDVSIR